MKLTRSQLAEAVGINEEAARLWLDPINAAGQLAQLSDGLHWAMFLAQCGHESTSFTRLTENFNYSSEALLAKYPAYFTPATAKKLGRNSGHIADQPGIANALYANRRDLGNLGGNDGWTFRARGLIGLTGRGNYILAGPHIGLDLLATPDLIGTDRRYAAEVAVYFWDTNNLNRFAKGDVRGCTKVINGGYNGLEDRMKRYERACKVLVDSAVLKELERILNGPAKA